MGFVMPEQTPPFLSNCVHHRKIHRGRRNSAIKIWLEVSDKEQKRRFEARIEDPLRQWKLSPGWTSPANGSVFPRRDMMLKATDTKWAPCSSLPSDDKKRARLNCIHHILEPRFPAKSAARDK